MALGRTCSYYYLDYRTAALFNLRVAELISSCSTRTSTGSSTGNENRDDVGDDDRDSNRNRDRDRAKTAQSNKDACAVLEWKSPSVQELLQLLSDATEFAELPVRHNEDQLNAGLSETTPWAVDTKNMDSPHVKTFLLLQAHIYRLPLPISDYVNDTKSVLDQIPRVLNALIDIAAEQGCLPVVLTLMKISRLLLQAMPEDASELLQLPGVRGAPAVVGEGGGGGGRVVQALELQGVRTLDDVVSHRTSSSGGISALERLVRSIFPVSINDRATSTTATSASASTSASAAARQRQARPSQRESDSKRGGGVSVSVSGEGEEFLRAARDLPCLQLQTQVRVD